MTTMNCIYPRLSALPLLTYQSVRCAGILENLGYLRRPSVIEGALYVKLYLWHTA
jgi:hypothetical protein